MTRLRGNTFLLLLLRAGNLNLSAPVEFGQTKDGITRPNMMADLLRMSHPAYVCRQNKTLASYFSKYLSGDKPFSSTYFDFHSPIISRGLDERIRTDYPAVLEEMQCFCERYLCDDADTLQYLAAGLIDAILEDDTFSGAFDVGSEMVSKEELNHITQVSLYPFLLSIWNHILLDHPDTSEGKETYEVWTRPDGYNTPRRIITTIGQERACGITVIKSHSFCIKPETYKAQSPNYIKPKQDDSQEAKGVNQTDENDADEPIVIDAIPVDPKIEQSIVKADRIYHQQANTIYNIEHIDTFNA